MRWWTDWSALIGRALRFDRAANAIRHAALPLRRYQSSNNLIPNHKNVRLHPVTDEALQQWLRTFTPSAARSSCGALPRACRTATSSSPPARPRTCSRCSGNHEPRRIAVHLYLMAHLARHGLPVPAPIADLDNEYLGTLSGSPSGTWWRGCQALR